MMALSGRQSYKIEVYYPQDNYVLVGNTCPHCKMAGVNYSNGEKKSHTCTKCEKIFYA